ncbi:hypothetical protein ACP70R_046574 [Stipagrostis hirtigluma subsp. patula]
MTGFALPTNFVDDPDKFARRVRRKIELYEHRTAELNKSTTRNPVKASAAPCPRLITMAEKTIRDYSAPSSSNVPTGNAPAAEGAFELKPALINMVNSNPFCGKASEDANSHLQNFLEICGTLTIKDVTPEVIRMRLFPFSLLGKAKQWFYSLEETVRRDWRLVSDAFLAKYFPPGKTNALRNRITSFHQLADESIAEAWERFQEYIHACPHHGMEEWLLIQNFYNGLARNNREHLDAASGGAFTSLTVRAARQLIEKMVSNQGWENERAQTRARGVHQIDSVDMLAAKMDLLLKSITKPESCQALDSRMTCEVCGNSGHSGTSCPETQGEEANFLNNNENNNGGFRPRENFAPGWNTRPRFNFDNRGPGNNFSSRNSTTAGQVTPGSRFNF